MQVQYAASAAGIPRSRKLRRWARAALADDAKVTLRIVDRREARRLNREFRGRDYATNVLTFVYGERRPLEGDIVLCAPVVRAEAGRRHGRLEAHYAHLVVHGMLHLQGFDHERARQAQFMELLESEIVTRLGYPDPYARARPAARTRRRRPAHPHNGTSP
jgi:probable rRNA maturation factor